MKSSISITGVIQSLFVAIILLFNSGCTEELEGEFFTFERSIVVDGVLSDQNETQLIRISYTAAVDLTGGGPLTGASVSVESSSGDIILFQERSAGVYSSTVPTSGIPGVSYKLIFVTEEGQRYESNPEEMASPVGINQITQRFTEIPSSTTNGSEAGLQFFVDSEENEADASYFRYDWNETHRVNVPYPSAFFWDRSNTGRVLPREQPLGTCYSTFFSNSIILGSTVGQTSGGVQELPVHFASSSALNFTDRYSIEVTQYSISQQAHSYYTKLKRFNESNGSLFDTQQGVVFGNIKSLDNEDEVVLGYFEVAATTKFRAFFNASEFDPDLQAFINGFSSLCPVSELYQTTDNLTAFYEADGDLLEMGLRAPFRPYDYDEEPQPNGTTFLGLNACVNCTVYGRLERPPFWVD